MYCTIILFYKKWIKYNNKYRIISKLFLFEIHVCLARPILLQRHTSSSSWKASAGKMLIDAVNMDTMKKSSEEGRVWQESWASAPVQGCAQQQAQLCVLAAHNGVWLALPSPKKHLQQEVFFIQATVCSPPKSLPSLSSPFSLSSYMLEFIWSMSSAPPSWSL